MFSDDKEWIEARGTTLGADNGVGAAAMIALMREKNYSHPPLELLFTTDEESGLTGARNFDTTLIKSKRMINLDSEEERNVCIGCAGGAKIRISLPYKLEEDKRETFIKINVRGLKGGHSGVEIHLQRANAIKTLVRIITKLGKEKPLKIASITGGNKDNAIPREAQAVISINSCVDEVKELMQEEINSIIREYEGIEEKVLISFEEELTQRSIMTSDSTNKIVDLINILPDGVFRKSPVIADLIETSSCLSVVREEKNMIEIILTPRSSSEKTMDYLIERIKSACRLSKAEIIVEGRYPGWNPDKKRELLKTFIKVHDQLIGIPPRVSAVHAGLECGVIGEKIPGIEMISFGPEIRHAHSPDEKIKIKSVKEFWKILKEILRVL